MEFMHAVLVLQMPILKQYLHHQWTMQANCINLRKQEVHCAVQCRCTSPKEEKNKASEADSHKHELGEAPGSQGIITSYIKKCCLLQKYIIHINIDNLTG